MTDITARQQEAEPTADQVRRGRRTALILFAIGFGPMIFATIMYYTGWLHPESRSNHGELILPAVPVEQLNLAGADGDPLEQRFGPLLHEPKWMMIVVAETCGSDCERLMYLARQVNIALGKNANRMGRGAWIGEIPEELQTRWRSEYSSMERLRLVGEGASWPNGIDPAEESRILLVDPFGNVMMHYGTEHTGKEMLEDLKHLMKLSQIG
ncbi:hypothetical protein SAMN05216203_2276 [Marinobacter daqiaonensis]|uniref:Cytochrome oxidase Cu insertion factor, SCO1/SenC/PrrC family n=1 Tax=Marinobacter daqiaonensis TaxID=650891 RepID=A0A1I6IGT6_9GAMM|nr:hypothetical protein [Marinobacter daqiaonensis]SFR65859.1 hypothetical protein SAMN05216203_2276 [Marinobacter daqiaonensis]